MRPKAFFATILCGIISAIGVAAFSTQTQAAEFEWRLNVNTNEARPSSKVMKAWAERVEQKSNGRMKITVSYANSLGFAEADVPRVLKSGGVEFSQVYAGYYGRDMPEIGIALPQGVVLSQQEMVKLMPPLMDIYTKEYAKWDITVIGWVNDTIYDLSVFCKDKVDSLAAMKGKKVRVWSKDQVDTFAKLGVPAQIVPQNELYLALQTGVIDCAVYVAGIAKTISLQEVTKFALPLHTYTAVPNAIGVSNRHWSRLPKDLQAVVLEAGKWMDETSRPTLLDNTLEIAAKKEFTDSKQVTFLPPLSKADQTAFFNAANEVWEERAKSVGREAPNYRAVMMKAIEAARK